MSIAPFPDSIPPAVSTTPPLSSTPPLFPGEEDYFVSGHFYPHLPILRYIPLYEKDKYYKSRTACNKFVRAHGRGTPGLFLVFCIEHRRLIGFHAMKYSESERTVHDLLFSRFPEAPELVVYDNACNTHLFSLFREPEFFKDTVFAIDRLHENSHGTCSPAYCPDNILGLRGKNTQIAEQKNAPYISKRAQLFAMGHFMFLFHLRYYTWCRAQQRAVSTAKRQKME